ncbi:hypothetical protein P7C73_g3265, partial [Tremellales sp. Uapishka_1]
MDDDAEFRALPAKQRSAVDRAFQRGLDRLNGTKAKGRGRKRRKIEALDSGGGGGFVASDNEGGGFIAEDTEGGGFVADENEYGGGGFVVEADEEGGGGGFVPDDTEEANATTTTTTDSPNTNTKANTKLPLHFLPSLLTSLNLPSDADVLQVFRASATGWDDRPKRGREDDGDEDLRVELKDFRAVCAALMSGDGDGDGDGDGGEGKEEDSNGEEGSVYSGDKFEDEADSLSSLSSLSEAESETEDEPKPKRGKGKAKASAKADLLATQTATKLNSRQKDIVRDIWDMLKSTSTTAAGQTKDRTRGSGEGILGRDEIKKCVRFLGEMWSDDEITEMVTLFSSQHEGRGLSFDDFGGIMVRAGLV